MSVLCAKFVYPVPDDMSVASYFRLYIKCLANKKMHDHLYFIYTICEGIIFSRKKKTVGNLKQGDSYNLL